MCLRDWSHLCESCLLTMTLTIELWIAGLCYNDIYDNFAVNVDVNDDLGGGE